MTRKCISKSKYILPAIVLAFSLAGCGEAKELVNEEDIMTADVEVVEVLAETEEEVEASVEEIVEEPEEELEEEKAVEEETEAELEEEEAVEEETEAELEEEEVAEPKIENIDIVEKPDVNKETPVKDEVVEVAPVVVEETPAPAQTKPAQAAYNLNPTTAAEAQATFEAVMGMTIDQMIATYDIETASGVMNSICGWWIDKKTGEIISEAEANARIGNNLFEGPIVHTNDCDFTGVYIIAG